MIAKFLRAGLLGAALGIAGCTESTLNVSGAANAQLPDKLVKEMQAKGMVRTSSILARVFKEEGKLEIWKQKSNGRFDVVASYNICKMSGKLGPKFTEGDRQSPEGFYTVRPGQLNPNSSYHLAFNIGYPNAYDRANGRTGSNLMVHGECSSSGCFSMNNAQIEQIYAFARDAFKGGQTEFQIQSFPFRMTAANMARYRNDPNYEFWKMLKVGYDHFEVTKAPPKVDVCEKRYVFNQFTEEGASFSPAASCPSSTTPDQLASAYQSYQSTYEAAFSKAVGAPPVAPAKESILGINEAKLVSDWSKKKARGERVPIEPPSMQEDGTVKITTRMGRVDSPAGRKLAALDAEKAAKEKAAEEKRLAKERVEEEKRLAKQRAEEEKKALAQAKEDAKIAASKTAEPAAGEPAETAQAAPIPAPAEQKTGILGGVRKRLTNIFGS